MLSSARRAAAAVLAGGTSAALVLTGSPAQAAAKAVTYPNISVDTATSLLPAAKLLPVHMKLVAKIQVPGLASAQPCPESPSAGLMLKGSQVTALYMEPHLSLTSAQPVLWTISATVFHNQAKARAAMAAVVKAERACPKTSVDDGSGATPTWRTYSAAYAVGAWTGYRSIDHAAGDPTQGEPIEGGRLQNVYLTRGNVLLQIEEAAPAVANSGARQDAWRKSVTKLVLKSFDAKR